MKDILNIEKDYIGFNIKNKFQIEKRESYYFIIKFDNNDFYEIVLKTYKLDYAIRLCNILNTTKSI